MIFIGKLPPKINRRDAENTENKKMGKTSWLMLRNRRNRVFFQNLVSLYALHFLFVCPSTFVAGEAVCLTVAGQPVVKPSGFASFIAEF